jgi:two-component system, OmpR family, sensor histidine kinase MprB
MSLRARIAAVAGVAVAAVVVLIAIFTYVAVRSQLRGEVDDSLRERTARVADFRQRLPGPLPGPGAAAPPGAFGRLLQPDPRDEPGGGPFGGPAGYAQLIVDGDVIRPPGDAALPVDADARAVARDGGSTLTDRDVDGVHLRVLTQGVRPGVAFQVARPLTEIDDQLQRILIALIAIGAIGIAGGAALGAIVARTALVPIARFTARTEALRDDPDLSQRMEVVGNDEPARLARSFNATLDELERSVESQRLLVADASHELRTPIASLRANIQSLLDADRLPAGERERMRADIVEELDELTALVGDVVELARGAKPPEELDDVRLDQLVDAIAERERRRAGERVVAPAREQRRAGERVVAPARTHPALADGARDRPAQAVALTTHVEPTLVAGDAERIGRAVSNLIGNAVKWSPPGGVVEIGVADGVLTVRDHGPGFEPADLPHVFERFYRAAAARGTPGSGLGLAIVKQAAEAHDGFAEATNAPGGGALLRVGFGPTLPLGADAASATPGPRAAQSR